MFTLSYSTYSENSLCSEAEIGNNIIMFHHFLWLTIDKNLVVKPWGLWPVG